MNKHIILALALFATAVSGAYRPNAPLVEQVRALPDIPQVHQILGSAAAAASAPAEVYAAPPSSPYSASPSSYPAAASSSSYAPSNSYAPATSYVPASSYAPTSSYAPSSSYVPASSYSSLKSVAPSTYSATPAVSSYSASPSLPAYSAAPAVSSYNAAPAYPSQKWSVQNAYSSQLYPGPTQYKSYQSPPTYSTVALPVAPSTPVAKVWVPQAQPYSSAPAPY